MLSKNIYKMNSFIKLIIFILSVITIILSNNIISFIFIILNSILLIVLMRKNITIIIKKIFNIYLIILFLLSFVISRHLCLSLIIIYLNMIILFMTTTISHIYLSLLKLFYPLKFIKLNTQKLVFLLVYSSMYIHIFKLNIHKLLKIISYRNDNIIYLIRNMIKLLKRSNYLTKQELNNLKHDIDITNYNINTKLYGENKITLKDCLLVIIYIGIIILCVVKEVM